MSGSPISTETVTGRDALPSHTRRQGQATRERPHVPICPMEKMTAVAKSSQCS